MDNLLGDFIDRIYGLDWRFDTMMGALVNSKSVALGDLLSGG